MIFEVGKAHTDLEEYYLCWSGCKCGRDEWFWVGKHICAMRFLNMLVAGSVLVWFGSEFHKIAVERSGEFKYLDEVAH